jgi:hypothetical protein
VHQQVEQRREQERGEQGQRRDDAEQPRQPRTQLVLAEAAAQPAADAAPEKREPGALAQFRW